MKLEIDKALGGLTNPENAILAIRTYLKFLPTLTHDLPHAEDAEFCMEDHCVFATFVAFSGAVGTVAAHHEYIKMKSALLDQSYADVSLRFGKGDLYDDPDSKLACLYSEFTEEFGGKLTSLIEYNFYGNCAIAHEFACRAATAAGRLGHGNDTETNARDAYRCVFDLPHGAELGKALIGDAERLKAGEDPVDVLCSPLYPEPAVAGHFLAEWGQLRAQLQGSEIADWTVWINWFQDRIDGKPLNMRQLDHWIGMPLEEYPRASECNADYAKY